MKTQDIFGSLFDPQDKRLDKLGDPLVRLGDMVDWEAFRPLLVRIRPAKRKGKRNKPLTSREQQGNRTRAKVRCLVEHVFGAQCAFRAKLIRCIGQARSELAVGMIKLVYNMRRLCYLQGVTAPA